jgi:thiol-disulfide isomerase/thioredoxin
MTDDGHLTTMEPNPVWDEDSYPDTVDTLAEHADDLVYKVWGGDWCKDCRGQLPDFAAALKAAGVPEAHIEHYPTEKEDDGSKTGPGVEEYGIEYIPTVVVERVSRSDTNGASGEEPRGQDSEEIVRFVESEDRPIAVYLADEIDALELEA